MTDEQKAAEKEAAKAAAAEKKKAEAEQKKAEKEAAKAAAQSASSATATDDFNAMWPEIEKALNYFDPKTGVMLVRATRPDTDKGIRQARKYFGLAKVLTVLPCDEGEQPGKAVAIKTTNGFKMEIVKGVMVRVPTQIQEEIEESLRQTLAARGHKVRIEDPITHQVKWVETNMAMASAEDRSFIGG